MTIAIRPSPPLSARFHTWLGLTAFVAWLLPPASPGQNPVHSAAQSGITTLTNGPFADSNFFPIAVWVQNPRNAPKFKAAGINLFVGLWRGPTVEQLAELQKSGMYVICSQNRAGLENITNSTIAAWMHGDEPDNAQSLGSGKGYGPPISTEKIQRDYERIRTADPSRPVLLNLGQGVAWDQYIGRGVRRNHPEDYPEYAKGADIVSFDIYPVVHEKPEIAGKLEFVARGVERLIQWTGGRKPVWNCIECTHISNPPAKATPHQVRAEVWMSLVHGSRGLIYFVHQFKPAFKEAALLEDPEMLSAVTEINQQIRELAPVLNSPSITGPTGPTVKSSVPEVPIALMLKRQGGTNWLFAVNMRNQPTSGTFTISGLPENASVEVLGESRRIASNRGGFTDDFKPYDVHLYRVGGR